MKRSRLFTVLDALWLIALCAYAFSAVMDAPYHGDETTYIFAANDFDIALRGDWDALRVDGIGNIGSYERLMNGMVYPYTFGAFRYVLNIQDIAMPGHNWTWGVVWDQALASGSVVGDSLLIPARMLSTGYVAAAAIIMFGIGWRFGGRPTAYIASALLALNPILLLQGRRALPEGALMFIGLLTIWIASGIAARRERGQRAGWGRWLALMLASALAICVKQTGLLFVAAAFAWIVVPELIRRRRIPFTVIGASFVTGVGALAIAFALSPGLWNDPPQRLRELFNERVSLVNVQVSLDPNAPMSLETRALSILRQPFLTPLQHYESYGFAESPAFMAWTRRYDASPLTGLRLDQPSLISGLLGATLTAFAVVGTILVFRPRYNGGAPSSAAIGLFIWLTLAVGALMVNPLPWQRYYLPLLPIVVISASVTLAAVIRDLRGKTPVPLPQSIPSPSRTANPATGIALPAGWDIARLTTPTTVRAFDWLWILGLCAVILSGVYSVPFHGSETEQLVLGRDFYTAIIEGRIGDLGDENLWANRDTYQRGVDNSLPPFLLGAVMWVGGYRADDLSVNGTYLYDLDYDTNVGMGIVPSPVSLATMRVASVLLLCLSVVMLFQIGRLTSGRILAYLMSGIYALSPAMLMHGRRAAAEAAIFAFGLAAIYAALWIARRHERGLGAPILAWIALILTAACAAASGEGGYPYALLAFGIVGIGLLLTLTRRAFWRGLSWIAGCLAAAGIAAAGFYAFTPGLWSAQPALRWQQIQGERGRLQNLYIAMTPTAPLSTWQRIDHILTQPFMRPLQYVESGGFLTSERYQNEIAAYEATLGYGVRWGIAGGGVLLAFALLGLLINLTPRGRGHGSLITALAWYAWIAVALGIALANPVPWQRDYLVLLPPFAAFAALGLTRLIVAMLTTNAPAAARISTRIESAAD
jgi:4-amino-4-deoxy-L-arabinose transferase-like glycosyltransferase